MPVSRDRGAGAQLVQPDFQVAGTVETAGQGGMPPPWECRRSRLSAARRPARSGTSPRRRCPPAGAQPFRIVAVATYRHFTRAAASFPVAQPALSHQVRLLEQELGIELFERSRSGCA
jgi:regulatory helix-turn-helix LysR family protein